VLKWVCLSERDTFWGVLCVCVCCCEATHRRSHCSALEAVSPTLFRTEGAGVARTARSKVSFKLLNLLNICV
jgi:hypothetical protein